MGAIKEGDDPEDYYIEHNKPLAFVSLGTLTAIGLIATIVVAQNKMGNPGRKSSARIPIGYTQKTGTGRTKRLNR